MAGIAQSNPELYKRSINRTVAFEDDHMAHGFTQVPNWLFKIRGLSRDAKLTYVLLLRYAWQKEFCYPAIDSLEADLEASRFSVMRWMKELRRALLIGVEQRGLGLTNVYIIKRPPADVADMTHQPDVAPTPHPDVAGVTQPNVAPESHPIKKKTQVKKTHTEEYSEGTGADAPRAATPRRPSLKQSEPHIYEAREAITARYLSLNDLDASDLTPTRQKYVAGDAEALARKCAERGDALAAVQAVWDEQWSNGTYPNRDHRLLKKTLEKLAAFRRGELTRKAPAGKPLDMGGCGPSAAALRADRLDIHPCPECGWISDQHDRTCSRKGGAS